ncbi:hypothetical protein IQ266_00975 [filamentous cyanobacterium LEGE 11480]|uniref:Uncharacterized protein n=1 Tax=Romeriopsis navalis LEGE 11480 TaxID=2777977 RepID=A0A928VIE1_9CYAN|nr:hypothetical protein [Romeriopsis navalis LEGE 11480]
MTTNSVSRIATLVSLSLLATVSVAPAVRSQSVQIPTATAEQAADSANLKSVGFLSLKGGQKLMGEATQAISGGNYSLAVKKFKESRQVFNQLSNFYQQLGGSFAGVDNRIADGLRKKALDAAQMRDEATYQLALAHRAQNQPELSVPLLVQIIRSQNPTRELGKKSYAQLVELGFAETAYPRKPK